MMRSTFRLSFPVVLTLCVASAGVLAAPATASPSRAPRPLPPAAGSDVLPRQHAEHAPQSGLRSTADTPSTLPIPTGLPRRIEPLAPYVPQDSCDYSEKPGVVAFERLLMATYPDSGSYGIVNTCLREGSTSEHAEGRAWDWAVSVGNASQVAEVNEVFAWLFAADAKGNQYAMARRLGIMYIIWNSHIWGAYAAQDGWRPYSCSGVTACHQDHVHFSFGWAGARAQTSFWTKSVAPTDYGPCVPAGSRYAPLWSGVNRTRCPAPPVLPAPTSDLDLMRQDVNLAVVSGDSGDPVRVIQRQVGVSADGSYGPVTADAVGRYQSAHRLPVTGWVGTATWQAFIAAATGSTPAGSFSGSGRTDRAVYRRSGGRWYVQGYPSVHYGISSDRPVPADYTGDGRNDIAVYRPSNGGWYVRGAATVHYGLRTDVPVPADYTGDGRADIAVYRPSNGSWYVRGHPRVHYGLRRDVPVPADYTGAGRADIAVYRPSNGGWYVRGSATVRYGARRDVPVPGDYTGDGRADRAVYRRSNGSWYVRGAVTVKYGVATDTPVPGDYRGSGRWQPAVYRPSNGGWYVLGLPTVRYGTRRDLPLPLPTAVARRYG